jgi:hypothetical protein
MEGVEQNRKAVAVIFTGVCLCILLLGPGCGSKGYSNETLYQEGVKSIYVEMFENQSFRRGVEYELTDALAKRIEAQTPYKIVSNRDKADTVLSGQIMSIGESVLTLERQTGRPMEKDVELRAVVNWKNLKTGEFLIERKNAIAAASYSEWQSQGFEYGSSLAANRLAQKIVELMEKKW